MSLVGPGYAKSSLVDTIARQLVARAEAIPGVESAAMASALPLQGGVDMIFNIPGRTPPSGRHFDGDVQWGIISADYFRVLNIPLIAGRLFNELEPRGTVLISQTMARQFWSGEDPVGKEIFIGSIREALFLDNQLSPVKIRTMEQVAIDSTAEKKSAF